MVLSIDVEVGWNFVKGFGGLVKVIVVIVVVVVVVFDLLLLLVCFFSFMFDF